MSLHSLDFTPPFIKTLVDHLHKLRLSLSQVEKTNIEILNAPLV